jgi:tetratricopeptide (TPR) repeat protein
VLGDVALAQAQPEEAFSYGSQALDLARREGYTVFESCALRVIGEAMLQQGQLVEAEQQLEEAWQLQDDVDDIHDRAAIKLALARLMLGFQKPEQARDHAQEGLAYARKAEAPHLIGPLEAILRQLDPELQSPQTQQ